MALIITPYVLISILTTVITIFIALICWKLCRGSYLALVMFAVSESAMGAALELAAVGAPVKEFWFAIKYFGMLSAPVFFSARARVSPLIRAVLSPVPRWRGSLAPALTRSILADQEPYGLSIRQVNQNLAIL